MMRLRFRHTQICQLRRNTIFSFLFSLIFSCSSQAGIRMLSSSKFYLSFQTSGDTDMYTKRTNGLNLSFHLSFYFLFTEFTDVASSKLIVDVFLIFLFFSSFNFKFFLYIRKLVLFDWDTIHLLCFSSFFCLFFSWVFFPTPTTFLGKKFYSWTETKISIKI